MATVSRPYGWTGVSLPQYSRQRTMSRRAVFHWLPHDDHDADPGLPEFP